MEENFIENINYFKKNKVDLIIQENTSFDISEYIIEFKSKSGKLIEKIENISELKKIDLSKNIESGKIIKFKKKKFHKKRFYKKKAK